jgi:hypothetical protein
MGQSRARNRGGALQSTPDLVVAVLNAGVILANCRVAAGFPVAETREPTPVEDTSATRVVLRAAETDSSVLNRRDHINSFVA